MEGSKWTGHGFGGVPYDPQEGLIAIFSRWRGTVLPMVVQKNMFWLLILIHVILLTVNEYFYELTPMDVSIVIGLPASLLIFLTVFYNGNCYTRYFELWNLTCELTAIVNNWVLQTAFIFDELDLGDGLKDGIITRDGSIDVQIADGMWLCTRRILSAMEMLMMALDVSVENVDWLGRPVALPNIMAGDGMDDDEYQIMMDKGLLTLNEIEYIKTYVGMKCQVPLKWALTELRDLCKPQDRTCNQAKNYEAMQEIAANFNKTAVLIVTTMQQPVPFVYFHVLKLMMILVNCLIAYELVNTFEDSWAISIITFAIVSSMLLGLQEIAGAMADPFGSDDTDFDTYKICKDAYENAVAYLKCPPPPQTAELPLVNPLKLPTRPLVRRALASSPMSDREPHYVPLRA